MRPKTIITYEIKGFQQTIAILPDKCRTYKVIDKADTACHLLNSGINTYQEARSWAGTFLWMHYGLNVEDIQTDWIETTNTITRAARRARVKARQLHRRYNDWDMVYYQYMVDISNIIYYIRWQADLSNFSFKKRTR